MQDRDQYLTKERIFSAARTIQAVDSLAEEVYNNEHAREVDPQLPGGDAAVAEFMENLTDQLPGHVLLADGHGYRMSFTLLVNLLIACNREDLAEVVMNAKAEE